MHIYIRTGDNENTGIEFLNGKGWELTGYERKGFAYTPPAGDARRYVFKERWNGKILPFQGGEKALAAMVLAVEELRSVDGDEEIKTVTWIREGHDKLHNLLMMLGLDRSTWTAEPLRDEIQHTIYTYLTEGPNHVEVSVSEEDFERVTYDSSENNRFGYFCEDKPQGFSVTFGDTVEHYSVPEFLRHTVYMLHFEQGTLARAVLLVDKLSKMEPSTPVQVTLTRVIDDNMGPVPAGEVLERLQHFICAYTVNDDSKIIVIDGGKTDEDSSVRKVDITAEALKKIEFYNAPGLSGNPKKLSDFNTLRSINDVGFTVVGFSGKRWKFDPGPRSVRSIVYCKNYEDRALAVATLATLRVMSKHQYCGELQIVSDVLSPDFVDEVNGIMRGRDFYETLSYLKGFFNVEEVNN
nr:MAG TPA: hypothetical protein [Caudoviricetes sp.]